MLVSVCIQCCANTQKDVLNTSFKPTMTPLAVQLNDLVDQARIGKASALGLADKLRVSSFLCGMCRRE